MRKPLASRLVLDASALLAVLNVEPGAHVVAAVLAEAVVSAVNLSEVIAKLADGGASETAIRAAVARLSVEVVAFDAEQAYAAGLLSPATRFLGLSLGDRVCLSLARRLGVPAMTADRAWGELNLGIEVQLVR